MTYSFTKIYETEYCAVIEADTYEEALAKLTPDDFDMCDKPIITEHYAKDEDFEEYEWELTRQFY